MNESPQETGFSLPWYDDTLSIQTTRPGIDGLIARYNGKEYPLVDFLNQFLVYEHEDRIEAILTKYEDKLHIKDITSLSVPVIPENYRRINRNYYAVENFSGVTGMVNALISEYRGHLLAYDEYFARWDKIYNHWYLRHKKSEGCQQFYI